MIGVDNARRTLEAGFTTVRDLGSDIRGITALRDAIANGALVGPTIVAAGPMISITGGHGDPANNANRDVARAARARAATNALFKRAGVWLVPTMSPARVAVAQARAGALSKATLAKALESAAVHARNVGAAIRDGVKIGFGTDSGVAEHGRNAGEFSLLVDAGMTPAAAIRAATLDAAALVDRVNQLGSIEPGKDADIIAVAASPLNDVTEVRRIRFVMRRGIVHKLDGLRQAFPVE